MFGGGGFGGIGMNSYSTPFGGGLGDIASNLMGPRFGDGLPTESNNSRHGHGGGGHMQPAAVTPGSDSFAGIGGLPQSIIRSITDATSGLIGAASGIPLVGRVAGVDPNKNPGPGSALTGGSNIGGGTIGGALTGLGNTIASGAGAAAGAAGDVGSSLGTSLSNAGDTLRNFGNDVLNTGGDVVNTIANTGKDIANAGKDFLGGGWDWLKEWYDWVKKAGSYIWYAIVGVGILALLLFLRSLYRAVS